MTIGVEIRYKETPFPIALMSRVTPGFAFRDFGTFRVRLKSGAGGGGETINDLNAAILRDAEELLQTSGGSVDRKFYMLEYDPNGEARVLHLTFGPESQRFEDMLENLAA